VTGANLGKGEIDDTSTIYPNIIKRMHADGHQIGSHTWSHQDLTAITHSQRIDQVIKNEMAFRNILGFFPTYLRPPYGRCSPESGCLGDLAALGYHLV
jgi:chitin deacetylase